MKDKEVRDWCFTFSIPGEMVDLNTYIQAERSYYQKSAKIKKEETWRTVARIRELFGSDMVIMEEMYPLHILFVWHTKNTRKDPDNVDFARKYILDGMVNSGLLRNDSRKEIGSLHSMFGTEKDSPYVEVRVYRYAKDLLDYMGQGLTSS